MGKKHEAISLTKEMKAARSALRRAITMYTNKAIDSSWAGSQPKEVQEDIEQAWREAPDRLLYAIDKFEFAARAEAVKMIAAADNKAEAKPLPENAECRYCNGNMHFYSEIDAGPCRCAPEQTQVWLHKKSNKLYVIVGLSNTHTLRSDHPIDVVYRAHSIDAGSIPTTALFTRRLTDWSRSFIRACDATRMKSTV